MAEVLVYGNGGREQALAQAMEQSDEVTRAEVHADLASGLRAFSGGEKPFVIIGPEAPLVNGLADHLRGDGYVVFGASADAAAYEADKTRTVRLARNCGVVHPPTFITKGSWMPEAAINFARGMDPEYYVIKANGLAGGKGVVLPDSFEEAMNTVFNMVEGRFNGAGKNAILFAQRKHGPEVSAMVVVGAGKDDFVVLPLSQDHKRLLDGDQGPNTGGMGAYAPVPEYIVDAAQLEKIRAKTYNLLEGMEGEGVKYQRAVMYLGLMMSSDLKDDESDLIEINVRFGDPEAQVILPLLTHAGVDAYRLLRSAAEGDLEKPDIDFDNIGQAALTVCLAAAGYPEAPLTGDFINGLYKDYDNVSVQLAGAKQFESGGYATDGGRVLYVTGVGETVDQAAKSAYGAIGQQAIHFTGNQKRLDIGWQARQES